MSMNRKLLSVLLFILFLRNSRTVSYRKIYRQHL